MLLSSLQGDSDVDDDDDDDNAYYAGLLVQQSVSIHWDQGGLLGWLAGMNLIEIDTVACAARKPKEANCGNHSLQLERAYPTANLLKLILVANLQDLVE